MPGVVTKAILDRHNELAMNYSEDRRQRHVADETEAAGLWDLDSKVDQAMDALRCPPDDPTSSTLGGERRRVACASCCHRPELLLLDEPTNHLDAESVSWLEGHLRNYSGAILIVTHDRYFLDNVTHDLELDRGKGIPTRATIPPGCRKQKRLAQEGREYLPTSARWSARRSGSRPALARRLSKGALPALRGPAEAGQR
jgi:ATPase subunit of ABC transporter with duplicated ATPase domains